MDNKKIQENYDSINQVRFDIISIIDLLKKYTRDLNPQLIDFKENYLRELQKEKDKIFLEIDNILKDPSKICSENPDCVTNKKKYFQIDKELKRYNIKSQPVKFKDIYEKKVDKKIEEKIDKKTGEKVEDNCDKYILSPSQKEKELGTAKTWRKNIGAYCKDIQQLGLTEGRYLNNLYLGRKTQLEFKEDLINHYTFSKPKSIMENILKYINEKCSNCIGVKESVLQETIKEAKEESKNKLNNELSVLRIEINKVPPEECSQECSNKLKRYSMIRTLLYQLNDDKYPCMDSIEKTQTDILSKDLENSLNDKYFEFDNNSSLKETSKDICKMNFMKDKFACQEINTNKHFFNRDNIESLFQTVQLTLPSYPKCEIQSSGKKTKRKKKSKKSLKKKK